MENTKLRYNERANQKIKIYYKNIKENGKIANH